MKEVIKLENISFKYNKHKVILDNVSMTINSGSIVGIIGESGIGKTTFLRIINGSILSEKKAEIEGKVFIHQMQMKDETDFHKKIGTIYQNPDNQIIFSSVEDELAFGLENMCTPKEMMIHKIDEVLELVGITHLKTRNPNELSGGEKQLVIMAAILCLDIDILVLDEAMAQIDKSGKELILKALTTLAQNGKTIIMVEHEYKHLAIADEIYILKNHTMNPIKKEALNNNVIY